MNYLSYVITSDQVIAQWKENPNDYFLQKKKILLFLFGIQMSRFSWPFRREKLSS